MVHHVYRVENEGLVRFSLLPGGAVKKAQVLGDKLRLMAFEWTHLACPRSIYEQMVERMELKIPLGVDREKAIALIDERYGIYGTCGFIHPGMPAGVLESFLGKPAEVSGEQMRWKTIYRDRHSVLDVSLKKGRVEHLESIGLNVGNPVEGSLPWVEQALEDDEAKIPTEKLVEALKRIGTKVSKYERWRWCYIAEDLIEDREIDGTELLEIALANSTGTQSELSLFDTVNWDGRRGWVEKWLDDILIETVTPPVTGHDTRVDDAGALLSWLTERDRVAANTYALRYFNTGRTEFLSMLVECAPSLQPGLADDILLKAIIHAKKNRDGYLYWDVITTIPDCSLNGGKDLRAEIEKMPIPEADSYRGKQVKEALDSLSKAEK